MKAGELRKKYLEYFRSKGHVIVPSASMVIKNDPTLMFTNAGMNQFKDIFLGNQPPVHKRVANSQKCLRVSGKHNDLEEVGLDTYHHTMFEMLGNWSFGDYFKKEAIEWAWEFLTKELKIPADRLYATIFEGSPEENVPRDNESFEHWQTMTGGTENHTLEGSKKDNFWEMGETGPCGPCSEIHIDIRSENERNEIPGHLLVNKGHPQVIEIWNLVFIQFNRKADGSLETLPARHVDTGMGFERLCMVMQGKTSNYDTDIFQPVIGEIATITGRKYGGGKDQDVAMRVIADHLRAVAFSIADGQMPSNNKAGYVIRRILRRAIRYGFTNLGMEDPFIYRLVPVLSSNMGDHYPELLHNENLISKVIKEEEISFLRTLEKGLKRIERKIGELRAAGHTVFPGDEAFVLYDTYGFPPDLTNLILRENNIIPDEKGFEEAMKNQKTRSRDDAAVEAGDWIILRETEGTHFTGYRTTEDEVRITRYRKIKSKGREIYHIVLDRTPFYAESGGQAGDTGILKGSKETINITDTIKENNLIIHLADSEPSAPEETFIASVDSEKRRMTANNHTATHLLHHALRKVLGTHVEQKGSLVTWERLRFDFSHFKKLSPEEIEKIEKLVNRLIRENIEQTAIEDVPMEEAGKMGAIALFGEKYGEKVRVIRFGDSIELCGGTHTGRTGSIGIFRIVSEGAISAGIRRIEALTGETAEDYLNSRIRETDAIGEMLRSTGKLTESVSKLVAENNLARKKIEKLQSMLAAVYMKEMADKYVKMNGFDYAGGITEADSVEFLKLIAGNFRNSGKPVVAVIGAGIEGKAHLVVTVSDNLAKEGKVSAIDIIRTISPAIEGGGGGQPFLASAGGKNVAGLQKAISLAEEYLRKF
ncbi:MAG: alanine--tRNA ligase [Bacteroidales bacterium]|nr:alanine--tRNA ligase [Bacteroidales bacterium]